MITAAASTAAAAATRPINSCHLDPERRKSPLPERYLHFVRPGSDPLRQAEIELVSLRDRVGAEALDLPRVEAIHRAWNGAASATSCIVTLTEPVTIRVPESRLMPSVIVVMRGTEGPAGMIRTQAASASGLP